MNLTLRSVGGPRLAEGWDHPGAAQRGYGYIQRVSEFRWVSVTCCKTQ